MVEIQEKYILLRHTLDIECVAVAFSGGVDSTFLLWAALDVLGPDRVLALTASSPIIVPEELEDAKKIAAELGVRHILVPTCQLKDGEFIQNPPDRCYLCKRLILEALWNRAKQEGFQTLLEGSNRDDRSEFRPGMRAVAELNVRSPLDEVGLSKEEIRTLSKQANLPTWDKPTQTCLATRFPHGSIITLQGLEQVAQAEGLLKELGFQGVRVRHHGSIARIEVRPEDLARVVQPVMSRLISNSLRELGFGFVTLDLAGYKRGSLEV